MIKIFLALAVVCLMLSASAVYTFVKYHSINRTPPVVAFTKTESLNSPIKPGQDIVVRIWRDKVRDDCPVTSYRQAINQDGRVFDLPTGKSAGGPVSRDYFDFAYPTLPEMAAGHYVLRVHLSYACPGVSEPFDYEQPPTLFRIAN